MRVGVAILELGLLASLAAGCARHAPRDRVSDLRDATPTSSVDGVGTSDAVDAADAADAHARPELGGFPQELELLDGKDKLGFVSVPVGAREPRPLMIALHGGSEKPQRACAAWRGVTEAYAFVVCPRGWGGNESALGWQNSADTAERVARAVAAANEVFGSWIKKTSTIVLVGFSMGGSQVALLARRDPRTYRRIVVGDSAHDPRPALTFSREWASGGGERAIFLCTTSGCEPSLRAAARNVASRKAPARLNIAPTQVHGLSAPVVQSMRRDWPWLVDGAEGWEAYVAPSDESLPGKTETYEPE